MRRMSTLRARLPRTRLPRTLLLVALLLTGGAWLPSLEADDAPAPAPAATPTDAPPAKAPDARPPTRPVTGTLTEVDGQRILTLWGSPSDRGYAQGYLLAEQIIAGVAHDFERVMKPFLPKYEMLVKKVVIPKFQFNERETAELEGLFAGLRDRLPKERLHIAALKRDIELVDVKALNTFGDWYGLGCSSLAVWGALSADGKPLVGRNFDFPAFDLVLRHQYVVVRAPAEGIRGYVGVSYPGCIGILTGLNKDGVFTAIHDVPVRPTLDKALRPNVPRLMAVRRLLEETGATDTCARAEALVRSWPTLYGNNIMLVGPAAQDEKPCAVVLEYDCRLDLEEGCTCRFAEGSEDAPMYCLACTNHHRTREKPENYIEFKKRWRYPKLAAVGGAERPKQPLTVEDMFGWMGRTAFPKAGVPQGRAESLLGKSAHHGTLHQAVAQPAAGLLHVRMGEVGVNIRDVPPRRYDVAALLARCAAAAAAPATR